MSKIAIYPGSFNPWHEGHEDVLKKALQMFDKVVIAIGESTIKGAAGFLSTDLLEKYPNKVDIKRFYGLLVDEVKNNDYCAVIRGLRNGHDLQYEMNQQYWNEDLGLEVPTVYFIADRKLGHISSSAIRMVDKLKEEDASNS